MPLFGSIIFQQLYNITDSWLYLNIYILGLPFLFFYDISTGIFSALGDSKTPFSFLVFSSTANILVDILFVAAFDMGVAGVAWATFLCQGVSCILAVLVVLKRLSGIRTENKVVLYSFDIFKKIAVIAVPSILQQSFISIGNIVLQSAINDCGVEVTAGYAAAVKLNNLVITSFTTLAACHFLYQRTVRTGVILRHTLSLHCGAFLLYYIRQTDCRRHSSRCRTDEKLYDSDFYGSDLKSCTCRDTSGASWLYRYLVCMADWLADRHGDICGVLSERSVGFWRCK